MKYSLSLPLLFPALFLILSLSAPSRAQTPTRPYQPLHIPEALYGKNFDLNLHKTKKSFWKGATTTTYAYNKESFWGPTVFLNQGDVVHLNVKNDLDEETTTHWHGMHIPARMDGGPHQVIGAHATWTASFAVKNNAATYWYHPHAHTTTQKQLTYGAGGLIIVRDPAEAKLPLPRTYGVDDIPLALTSRRFYPNQEFSFEGDNDKYGDYEFVNGTLDPEVALPAQFVRLRILNAEIERGYILGFSDNRPFYLIGTDGGLIDKPLPLKRLKLMVGERAEVLVDLGADKPGTSLDLMAYNSNQPFGFPGGERGTGRPNGGYLNDRDFRILHINIKAPTAHPITRLPETLAQNHYWTEADVTKRRTLHILGGQPGSSFYFDRGAYAMNENNQIVKLGAVEEWTIANSFVFGHSFHLHDVQFKIVSRSSGPVPDSEQGWKDTVFVARNESVTFLAKFTDFASDTDAYMYHCHMANHEDAGLMGQFLVVKDPATVPSLAFRAPMTHPVTAQMLLAANRATGTAAPDFTAPDATGKALHLADIDAAKPVVLFFIDAQCPCSRDAAVYFNQLQIRYADSCQVVGIIDGNAATARAWAARVHCAFPVLPDPDRTIIAAYGARSSVYSTLIAPGGTIAQTFPAYSRDTLTRTAAAVAALAHIKARPLDLAKAPTTLTAGCVFANLYSLAAPITDRRPQGSRL